MKIAQTSVPAFLAGSLIPILLLAGCSDHTAVDSPDSRLLQPPPATAVSGENLFPYAAGYRWKYSVRSKEQSLRVETVRVSSTRRTDSPGADIEVRQDGRVTTRESYDTHSHDVYLVTTGRRGAMTFLPPLPILRYPVRLGDSYEWRGQVCIKGRKRPGKAAIRMSTRERVKTPAGMFDAYRQDIVLFLPGEAGPVRLMTQRWLVPGIGVVRSRHFDGRAATEKLLTQFSRT